jgi:hypothetical protein
MTTPKIDGVEISWADIEIKIDPDAPPLECVPITVPGTCELEAALTVRLADLPDELRAALASGYAVLPPGLLEELLPPLGTSVSAPPPVCLRLFDARGALLERPGGCYCNTLDCPHRPAKGA